MTRQEWNARWIWLEPSSQFVFFRKTLELDSATSARIRVTADGRYVLWVNGEEIGRGPVRSEPVFLTHDAYDVPVQEGRNVICALVRHYGRPTLYWKPAQAVGAAGRGGFLLDSDVVSSDDTWRAAAAPYEPQHMDAFEGPPDDEVLRPAAMDGWLDVDFDDSDWRHSVVVSPTGLGIPNDRPGTDPFPFLAARPIPALASRRLDPVAQKRVGDSTIFDFGTITNAHVVLGSAGDAEARAGEDIAGDDVLMDVRAWRMQLRGGGSMTSFEPIGFRYLTVTGQAPRIHAIETTFPREQGARFECGDAELEAIWKAGVRTLDLCSTDAYIDCPSREQRAWLGDAYIHSLVSFLVNPDTSLARWNLRLHAQGRRPDGLLPMTAACDFSTQSFTIPDYTLHWVRAIARFFEHTGDTDLVAELLPVAVSALSTFEGLRDDAGLIADVPGWIFIDWAQTERGRNIAAMDALYILACEDVASCAEAVGDTGTAQRSRARADGARAGFEAYFDPRRGVYVDVRGGKRVSQQTNSLAILSGAAPSDRWAHILDYVLDPTRVRRTRTPADPGTLDERVRSQLMPLRGFDEAEHVVECQPFFAHFLHQALALAGRHTAIVESIRRWAPMVARNGCVEEYWETPPGRGSRCHAWAATPTYDLITHSLGVRPIAPGWRRVAIEPRLERARATVATPNGWIHVELDDARVSIELPQGMEGEFRARGRAIPLVEGSNRIVTGTP